MSVTIKDIALKAEVSITTVSRVLNDKPDVKSATKEKVLEVIKEQGFSPNIVARSLVLQKINVIGFVVPDITNPNFPKLARGIVDRAKFFDYSVMFFDTNHDARIEREAILLMRSKRVDGIILSFSGDNQDELHKLRENNFPCVQIYRKSSRLDISTVALDNVLSANTATKYLIDAGHSRVAHITRGTGPISGVDRLTGYKKALAEANISLREDWLKEGENSIKGGYRAMRSLLAQKERPTAVFAAHDLMAIGALEAVLDARLRVPEDISIIGHDNIEMGLHIRPRLTTMDTNKYRLGQISVDLLIEEMKGELRGQREIICRTELVERDSAGRPPLSH